MTCDKNLAVMGLLARGARTVVALFRGGSGNQTSGDSMHSQLPHSLGENRFSSLLTKSVYLLVKGKWMFIPLGLKCEVSNALKEVDGTVNLEGFFFFTSFIAL